MGSPETSEDFTDWEEIHFPLHNQTSSTFPPTHLDLGTRTKEQQDLPLQQEQEGEPLENEESPPTSPLPSRGSEADLPHQQQTKSDSKLSVVMGEVKTVICATWRRMVTALGFSFPCPTFAPAAALLAVILACIKIVQIRNRLLLLVREKDQRISQLLHQITLMNEILSARRRVQVLRIN